MNFHITFPNEHCLKSTLIYLITPCKYFIIFQWNVSKTITLCCLWSGEGTGLGGKWGDLPLQLLSAEASPSLDIHILLPPLQVLGPYREVSLQEKCFLPKTNWGHAGQIWASQEEDRPLLNSNSPLPYPSSHRPWSPLASWTSDLCGHTGPHAQRALCSVLCLMDAIIRLKFLIILNKGTHIFILHSESPYYATGPVQDTLQFYKHCVLHLSDMLHALGYSPMI